MAESCCFFFSTSEASMSSFKLSSFTLFMRSSTSTIKLLATVRDFCSPINCWIDLQCKVICLRAAVLSLVRVLI